MSPLNALKWSERSRIKVGKLEPGTVTHLSGRALNDEAGLPREATMPREVFGL
jgi:hypothetical protein